MKIQFRCISMLLTERTGMYEATIRAYLDCGASAQQTAALMHIHRTTVCTPGPDE
jgi:DNA-binding PucR family transcriptional regulator